MEEQRRFSRVTFVEKCFIELENRKTQVRLLDLSLRGALIEFDDDLTIQMGKILQICVQLGETDIILQFKAEKVHGDNNRAGLKFIEMDLDTMIHLRSIMEARTMDPDKVRDELAFLI